MDREHLEGDEQRAASEVNRELTQTLVDVARQMGFTTVTEYAVPGGRPDEVWLWDPPSPNPGVVGAIPITGFEIESSWRTRKHVKGENRSGFEDLRASELAIGVPHNDQKDLLRALLERLAWVGSSWTPPTALQGRTFEVVVAWHPLAGSAVTDAFHLDPGRLCVLLTRHRQACIVVGRDTDRQLSEGVPPATPGYLGWDPDPVLDGWDAHEAVFELLEPHVVSA